MYALPVITTTATTWEIIKTNNCGWYINPNVEELSQALAELFALSEIELKSMGQKAREHVLSKNNLDKIASKMKDEIYKLKEVINVMPNKQ